MNLQKERMKLGVHITIDDPAQLEKIREREAGIVEERVEMILKSGANVVLTTKGIDDLCLKMFIEKGAMAVRRCKKEDLRRIAKATGATLVSALSDLNGDEKFEASSLGHAEEVVQERISDDECILVKGTKAHTAASIILRGANEYSLDEMERSVHDSLSAVKRALESGRVVPGGGAVETALHIYLEEWATSVVREVHTSLWCLLTSSLGLKRTTCDWSIRSSTPRHPHNTCGQRSQGQCRACCPASITTRSLTTSLLQSSNRSSRNIRTGAVDSNRGRESLSQEEELQELRS